MRRRGIVIAVTATALMSLAAPAYAVTEDKCEDLGGEVEEVEGNLLCVFPVEGRADRERCEEIGFLTRDEDECIALID
ncbi:MAG: hypothetical protein ACRD0K_15870 [Egibacteraceae bacterium]